MTNGWDFLQQSAQNSLFSTQEQRDSEKIGKLQEMYISELLPFKNHTFKVKDDEEMQKLIESIEANGVFQPAIVFYNEEGLTEIVSGHRRQRALQLLGRETMPVIVKQMTRDEAIICMGETNLQSRENILPSEKAFTYRDMYEAMKRMVGRPQKNGDPVGLILNGRSSEELAKRIKESSTQIKRYIRLTYLLPELLKLVDEKRIGMRPAVELSYLPVNFQECIYGIYEAEEITPSHAQTIQIRKLCQQNLLDEEVINKIMMEIKPNQKEGIKLSNEIVNRFLSSCGSKAEMENRIIKALELLDKQERIQKRNLEKEAEHAR